MVQDVCCAKPDRWTLQLLHPESMVQLESAHACGWTVQLNTTLCKKNEKPIIIIDNSSLLYFVIIIVVIVMLVLWNCTLTLYAVCPSEISTLEYRQEYEPKTATRCDHLPVRIPNCKSSILWTLSCWHLINSICQHQIGMIMSMSQYVTILILMNHEVLF